MCLTVKMMKKDELEVVWTLNFLSVLQVALLPVH
jgi:hypothetical protein